MSHLPATPWTVDTRLHVHAIVDSKGQDVVYFDVRPSVYDGEPCGSVRSRGRTQSELAAMAQLVAAAPDLLAACRRLAFAAECRDNTQGDQCRLLECRAELAAAANAAREAIAKTAQLTGTEDE